MLHAAPEIQAVADAASHALERPLRAVEEQLAELSVALQRQDVQLVDQAAARLHQALAAAVDDFSRAARNGGVPPALRTRLARASGQVAAQRDALARATASLDRAIDVLLPRPSAAAGGAGFYSSVGGSERSAHSGGLMA